jgi:hypothetical protein
LLDLPEHLEHLELLVPKATKETPVNLVPMEKLGPKELLDLTELQDLKV